MTTTGALAFVDTETTGLDPFLHDAWEIAIILRVGGVETEHVFTVEPDLTNADAKGLEINRYHQRTSVPGWRWNQPSDVAYRLHNLLGGVALVASNPDFDAAMIRNLIGRHYPYQSQAINPTPWHHHTIDIATLAAGYRFGQAASGRYGGDFAFATDYPQFPLKSYALSETVGVKPPQGDDAHTALGDARWHRDVFDAVTGGAA